MRLRVLACLASLWIAVLSGWAQGRSVARLMVDRSDVQPGSTFHAALELSSPAGWHTYWRNPGDSGQRTKIEWTLPPGVTAGELQWPTPERLTEEGLSTYIYHGKVVFPVTLTVAADRAPGPVTLQARVSWLECKTECLPGRTNLSVSLTVGPKDTPSAEAPIVQQALDLLPKTDLTPKASAQWAGSADGQDRPFAVASTETGFRDFYPFESDSFDTARDLEGSTPRRILFKLTRSGDMWPKSIAGLLIFGEGAATRAISATLPLSDDGSAAPATATPALTTSEPVAAPASWSVIGLAFIGAFVGGMVLNIMPCVLPVIALKILGFVNQSREQPRRIRFLGFVYTLGVLASFAVLALLVILVQSAGRSASWGMQFQNPIFLVSITTLVTLVALNLFGVFEVTLHSGAMGAASDLSGRKGPTGAFFNGVFTTILATPCTAPFLAGALGFAFGQPPAILMALFLAAGLGLATPYLLLSIQPAWLAFLPKPGNWMITFKTVMGFPMAATAVWLLSLASDQFGDSGVLLVGLFLVCVSLAAWIFGTFIQTGTANPRLGWGLVAAVLVGAYVGILERQLNWRSPAPVESSRAAVSPGGINWKPWSASAVEEARVDGHPVLVDFTANWCLTCKVNKKIAIEVPAVRERLAALNFVTLKGDYTRADPAIAAELRRFERAGVPLVLVYSKDSKQPPRLLPTQLTQGIVLDALGWAAQ